MSTPKLQEAVEAAVRSVPLPDYVVKEATDVTVGVDSTDDPAAWITVVLQDDTPEEKQAFLSLRGISQGITRAIVDAGVEVTPYVRFVKQSELTADRS